MKYLVISFITIYQLFVSPILKQLLGVPRLCRYIPSCSEYAREVIGKYGIVKGTKLAVKRLLSCQPFGSKQTA